MSERAKRIFEYLRELSQLRTTVVRDCSDYEEVLWFKNVPDEPECYSAAWGAKREQDDEGDRDIWLEVRKKKEPPCPKVPDKCADWVSPSDVLNSDEGHIPELYERITIPPSESPDQEDEEVNQEPIVLELSDHREIEDIWLKYLEEKWEPWTEQHRKWKAVQAIYGQLFSVHQHMKRLGEEYKLILGLGLLVWKTPHGQTVRRHVVVGQADLDFDPNRGIFTVRCSSDGARLVLETDMLEPSERPIVEDERAVQALVNEASEAPWDRTLIERILRSFATSLHGEGTYIDSFDSPSPTSTPTVSFAPAIILRKRTTRNLIHAFSQIINQIKEGGRVPKGILSFCEISDSPVTATVSEHPPDIDPSRPLEHVGDVYFPLEYNDEQFQIVDKLGTSQGILVQGPPGTGKSHTIANLICHFLASGKRVLVTSQGPRALKVLKRFIPEQVRPLCVNVLGGDTESLQNLEDSVQGIQDRYETWDDRKYQAEISNLEEGIYKLKKKRADLQVRLTNLREIETRTHIIADGAYNGTAQDIAKKVAEKAQLHDWFKDSISETDTLPVNASSFRLLIEAYRRLQPIRWSELDSKTISTSDVPDITKFQELIIQEKATLEIRDKYASRHSRDSFNALTRVDKSVRETVKGALKLLFEKLDDVQRRKEAWVARAITEVLADHDEPWRKLRDTTSNLLEGIDEQANRADEAELFLPGEREQAEVKADAEDLLVHLDAGGKLGNFLWRPKIVKRTLYLVQEARIDGRPCNTPKALQALIDILSVDRTLKNLWNAWKGRASPIQGLRSDQVSVVKEHLEALENIFVLQPLLAEAKSAIGLVSGLIQPKWDDTDDLKDLLEDIEAVETEELFRFAKSTIEDYIQKVQRTAADPNSHDVNQKALKALEERNVEIWGEVLRELQNLEDDRELRRVRNELEEQLRNRTPQLAYDLAATAHDALWDERANHWEETWSWARADAWLEKFKEDHDERKLEENWQLIHEELKEKTEKLVAEKAWKFCVEGMTGEQRESLIAWAQAIKRIGKGKGRHASKHRRAAQEHMGKSRGAIPAWVMPFYRIAETIPSEPDIFDVAIVDEASQSGPEALLLLYLAKQVIIVGDDEQISPEGVGLDRDEVFRLMDQYLDDIPHKDTYGVETSLFAHAAIRFRSRIRLREHFRCMPEIIRFSNDLCYSSAPLEPLRQYPPERLEPPVVARYVQEGFREGTIRSINRPEAEALVNCVVECCRDPAYDGKTIGVISLLGPYQAREIESMLMERLEPEEIVKRQLVCGDAYAFQGDERGIIFLSLVVAPNTQFRALTREADKRRFNVAASRAKDQMWLFHSVRIDDLSPQDLRYKLLYYCLHPQQPPHVIGEPKFDSPFEEDVYWRIVNRGYRVVTQYPVAGRQIDLVVEGRKERLAIECYGDAWHGPERHEADMARQRKLERCGWTFWIVRGHTFYRDPEVALEPLWEKLEKLGIYPHQEPSDSHEPPITEEELIDSDEADDTHTESQEDKGVKSSYFKDEVMNNKEFWKDMAKWGKRTNSLAQLELRDIYHVINVMEDNWHLEPSEKSSAEKIAENAFSLGFKYDSDEEYVELNGTQDEKGVGVEERKDISSFSREHIRGKLLETIPSQGKMERDEAIRKTASELKKEGLHYQRIHGRGKIYEAIKSAMKGALRMGLIRGDSKYVWNNPEDIQASKQNSLF